MPIYLYIDRGTFVHRLHPTVKVFALFIMFWSVYWVDNPLALIFPIGLLMLWIAQLTDSWPNFYRLRWLFVILIFTTTIMWIIFYQRGTPLFTLKLLYLEPHSIRVPYSQALHWGGHPVMLKVTWLSITFGIGRGIKLAELLAASVLFLSTTKIEEFTYGLQRMKVPYRVSFAIAALYRFGGDDRRCAATPRLRLRRGRSARTRAALCAGGDSGLHGSAAQGEQHGDGSGSPRLWIHARAHHLYRVSRRRHGSSRVRRTDRARSILFPAILHRSRRNRSGEIAHQEAFE